MHREFTYTTQVLYVMKNELGLYKIGISNNPTKRARQVANNSGFSVQLLSVFTTYSSARAIEKELHTLFAEYRVEGEWFTGVDIGFIKRYVIQHKRDYLRSYK